MNDTLAASLRATVYYMNPDCGLNYILTKEQIMEQPIALARSIGRESKRLILAPNTNPKTPIRVGKKEAI